MGMLRRLFGQTPAARLTPPSISATPSALISSGSFGDQPRTPSASEE